MIIVEGPDGAGKTTLIQQLSHAWGVPIAPRVVATDTSAMVDLCEWTEQNLNRGFHSDVLYDRHRLISDPIYQAAIPTKTPDMRLYRPGWLRSQYERFMQCHPFIIMCLPPRTVVHANLADDPHNEAILPHIDRVYNGYAAALAQLKTNPRCRVIHYDYTYGHFTDVEGLLGSILDDHKKEFHLESF